MNAFQSSCLIITSFKRALPRLMYATFKCNPCTTIVSCYSSTKTRDESDNPTFNKELSPLARDIPKLNDQIFCGDMKVQIGKMKKINLPNRTGEYLHFPHKNNLSCLNTKFQKNYGPISTWITIKTARLYTPK